MPSVALSPAAATGAVVCPTNLPLLFPIRMRGRVAALTCVKEEDPCATNDGLWNAQRCTTQIPLPEKTISQLHEEWFAHCPCSQLPRGHLRFPVRLPLPGMAPGECLSQVKSVRAHSWGVPHAMTTKKEYLPFLSLYHLLLPLPPLLLLLLLLFLSSCFLYSVHLKFFK